LKDGHWLKEKLRVRGLDCPEMDTPEGKAAKRFVEGQMHEAVALTISTTKPDKWDRYLCDIFLTLPNAEQIFLNNQLLKCGHARRYDTVAPAVWERMKLIFRWNKTWRNDGNRVKVFHEDDAQRTRRNWNSKTNS
jgi:endonuclease YncB( thermonuclease family)